MSKTPQQIAERLLTHFNTWEAPTGELAGISSEAPLKARLLFAAMANVEPGDIVDGFQCQHIYVALTFLAEGTYYDPCSLSAPDCVMHLSEDIQDALGWLGDEPSQYRIRLCNEASRSDPKSFLDLFRMAQLAEFFDVFGRVRCEVCRMETELS